MKSFKKFSGIIVLAAAGILSSPLPLGAAEPVRTIAEIRELQTKIEAAAEKALPATVALLSADTGSSGSGIITTAEGLVLTAAHVTQGAEEVLVVFPDGRQFPGKILGSNLSKDIGVVQIVGDGPFPFIERGSARELDAGDWVIAMGHSAGFDPARTPPVRFGRVVSKGPRNFLTTDCTLIGGDSGGPLINLNGQIVGINSSIGTDLRNNNHAVIDGFSEDWDRLMAGEIWGRLSTNPFANPEMPVLGIEMGILRGADGVVVERVLPRSPAGNGGLRQGDLITAIDNRKIEEGSDLLRALAVRQGGEQITLTYLRDGRPGEAAITLSSRNEFFRED